MTHNELERELHTCREALRTSRSALRAYAARNPYTESVLTWLDVLLDAEPPAPREPTADRSCVKCGRTDLGLSQYGVCWSCAAPREPLIELAKRWEQHSEGHAKRSYSAAFSPASAAFTEAARVYEQCATELRMLIADAAPSEIERDAARTLLQERTA